MSLRLPNSLHQRLREFAKKDDVSINQFITSAVMEKVSALSTEEYIESRGKRADRAKFEAVLASVPDIEAEEHDR